jgi:putative protease
VVVIELSAPLTVGDTIVVKGPTTDFEQVVDSMQIEHQNIQRAEPGQSIGLKVVQNARENDTVYKKT